MFQFKKFIFISAVASLCFIITGCAGTQVSSFSYNKDYGVNEPKKANKCYDASVLLGVDIARAKEISKRVIVAVDATTTEETDTSIKAQRNRHIGLFVGSGGEELFINLKKIDNNKTFVTAATNMTFVGCAGQKAWSCQIIDEMVKMASK